MLQRLDISFYVVGYMKAANRFLGCGERLWNVNQRILRHMANPAENPDPRDEPIAASGVFIPLFEALNWGVALDDRLSAEWPEEPGRDWHKRVTVGSRVRALRYARNSVHHDWAQAIDLAPKYRHLAARWSIMEWEWTCPLPAKGPSHLDRRGEHEYRTRLVGQSVGVTLTELGAAFAEGVHILSDAVPGSVTGERPFELGPQPVQAA